MPVTALPTPVPQTSDPLNFDARADAFLAALPQFAIELNALPAEVIAALYATSTSSVAIGTGAKTFTIEAGKAYAAGQPMFIVDAASAANWLFGTVTSYNSTTGVLVMSITRIGGSGTKTNWRLAATGPAGIDAVQGGYTTIASLSGAATTDIGSQASHYALIGGTVTTITSFGANGDLTAPIHMIRWNAAHNVTHNATSMILPGAASLTVAAGDVWLVEYLGGSNWRVLSISPGAQTIAGTRLLLLASAINTFPYQSAAGVWTSASLTAFARTILDDADALTARATLGIGQGGFRTASAVTAAATTDLGSLATNFALISGAAAIISSLGSGAGATVNEPIFRARFVTGGHTLVQSATLNLPGNANIAVRAGDIMEAEYVGSGSWIVHDYVRGDKATMDYDATLAGLAALTGAPDKGIVGTGPDTFGLFDLSAGGRALAAAVGNPNTFPYFSAAQVLSEAPITAFARSILDDASAAAVLATLGLNADKGTFLPTLFGATAAGTTTYTSREGYYEDINGTVLFALSMTWSNYTGTGNMRVGGLPFVSDSGGTYRTVSPSFYSGFTLNAGISLGGAVRIGASDIQMISQNVNQGVNLGLSGNVSTSGSLTLSGHYRKA